MARDHSLKFVHQSKPDFHNVAMAVISDADVSHQSN